MVQQVDVRRQRVLAMWNVLASAVTSAAYAGRSAVSSSGAAVSTTFATHTAAIPPIPDAFEDLLG